MPKRKNTVKQYTPMAQGNDSWVEYIPFTMQEKLDTTRETSTQDEIRSRVVGWNWVDKKDNPLPQPKDEPEIFDTLSTLEMSCLLNVVFGYPSKEDVKN